MQIPKSVLVADDDEAVCETFRIALSMAGFRVFTAQTGSAACAVSLRERLDVALIDVRLPDANGLNVVKTIRTQHPLAAAIVISGFATARIAVAAMRLGAIEVLEKPVDLDQLVSLVSALDIPDHEPVTHALVRWAQCVSRAVDAPHDLPTIRRWARWTGASPGAIRNWCRTAGLQTKRSLNLARMLRAATHYQPGMRLTDLFDIIDLRTLARFLKCGAPEASPMSFPVTLEECLSKQQWITDAAAIDRLRMMLSRR